MKNIWWHLLYIFLAYLGAWLILTLAAVDLMWWWPWGRFSAGVPPVDPSARGTVIQAAVGWVGGVIGLGTFFLNRAQKQEHFKEEQEKDRRHFRDQQRLEREHFSEQQVVQRWQFDQQTLEGRFVDIQNRLADRDNLMMRANAAIRLAEIAQTPWPGEGREHLTEQSYPFFPRAAAQLSAALHMEHEQPARDEVKNAIGRMVQFARIDGHRLLYLLIEELARSNQSAVRALQHELSPYIPKQLATMSDELFDELIDDLSHIARLCDHDGVSNLAAWQYIVRGVDSRGESNVANAHNVDVRDRVSRLRDSGDALAHALRALVSPKDLPPDADLPALQKWQRESLFMLHGAFLAGSNLNYANLQGIMLYSVQLQGADLVDAKLHRAGLSHAGLQGAELYGAQLQGATLYNAQLQEANLSTARLEGAHLNSTHLQGAILVEAQLQNARLHDAELQGAILHDAQLQGASLHRAQLQAADLSRAHLGGADFSQAELAGAKLSGVSLVDANNTEPADFTQANWRDADFTNESGMLDEETYGMFIEYYGTTDEKEKWASRGDGADDG